ncbi:MAG: MarR family winged helix-turn-helix transcriptional regulator [Burkholderiaceae bacterium]
MLDGLLAQHAKQVTRQAVDMNRAEWFMMLELGKSGSAFPHEVARRTGMERSHVTAAARTLVERELVAVNRDDSDGRRVQLALTHKGKAVLRRGMEAYGPRRAALAAALTANEHAVLDRALSKLIRVAEQLLAEQQQAE